MKQSTETNLFVDYISLWENGVRNEYGKRADGSLVYLEQSYRPLPPLPKRVQDRK